MFYTEGCFLFFVALTLVSAPHLARSYHHLFPVDVYEEVLMETVLIESQK